MIPGTLSDFLDELLAIDSGCGFPEDWQRPRWMVVVMWWLVRVSTVMVVVMVRRMCNQTRMRQWIRGKADCVEWVWLLCICVLMLRVMMMVVVGMMVMVMSSLRSLVASL